MRSSLLKTIAAATFFWVIYVGLYAPWVLVTEDEFMVKPDELKPVTVVTAYFKIRSKANDSIYLERMRNFLPRIPCYLHVFTEESTVPIINDLRRSFSARTHITTLSFESLEMNRLKREWKHQRSLDPNKNKKTTADLYVVWHEKIKFMLQAIRKNVFDSDYFVWCDIGSFRTEWQVALFETFPDPVRIVNALRGSQLKLGLLEYVPFLPEETTVNTERLIPAVAPQKPRLGGGVLFGHQIAWRAWDSVYYKMLERLIQHGWFVGNDQKVYGAVAVVHPEMAQLIPARHYLQCRGDPWFFLHYFLSSTYRNEDTNLCTYKWE